LGRDQLCATDQEGDTKREYKFGGSYNLYMTVEGSGTPEVRS